MVTPDFPLRLDMPLPGAEDPARLAFASPADLDAFRTAQATYAQHRARVLELGGGCSDMQARHRAAFPAFAEASDALDRLTRKGLRLRRDLDGIPRPSILRDSLAPAS